MELVEFAFRCDQIMYCFELADRGQFSSRPDHARAAGRYEDSAARLTVGGLKFSFPALSLEVRP
jgi:hypothetical protein